MASWPSSSPSASPEASGDHRECDAMVEPKPPADQEADVAEWGDWAAYPYSQHWSDDPILKGLVAKAKETPCWLPCRGPYGRGQLWTTIRRQVLTPQELLAIGTWRQTRLELEKEQHCMEAGAKLSRLKLLSHLEQNPSVVLSVGDDAKPVVAGRKRGRGHRWFEFDAEGQRSVEEVTFVDASHEADRIVRNT